MIEITVFLLINLATAMPIAQFKDREACSAAGAAIMDAESTIVHKTFLYYCVPVKIVK